jgi:pimeloyl-ACP methyl ester carboxylesterase
MNDLKVTEFTVQIPQSELDDLAERLRRTRLPEPAPGDDWAYGVPNHYLAEALAYWRDEFDWRAVERRLNAWPHFRTELDGQPLHFIHARSASPTATPLLLAHSYPGSFIDFIELIDRLTDDFHVVVPSLPGFGFSTPVTGRGWTARRTAALLDRLMRGLGYEGYGVHGSDLGAIIGRELGVLAPEGFLGSHVLQAFSFPSGAPGEFDALQPKDYEALEFMQWFQSVGGYNAVNSSRPQTVAAALSDSPIGQLAWNELFLNFGNGTSLVTLEQLIAEVSLEWFTNTSASAGRYHFEDAHSSAEASVNHSRMGVAVFRDDFRSIRSFADRDNDNIVHWSEFPDGGHYAALERPAELSVDLHAFFARPADQAASSSSPTVVSSISGA